MVIAVRSNVSPESNITSETLSNTLARINIGICYHMPPAKWKGQACPRCAQLGKGAYVLLRCTAFTQGILTTPHSHNTCAPPCTHLQTHKTMFLLAFAFSRKPLLLHGAFSVLRRLLRFRPLQVFSSGLLLGGNHLSSSNVGLACTGKLPSFQPQI